MATPDTKPTAHISVRIAGKGTITDGAPAADPGMSSRCDLCHLDVDAVASVGIGVDALYACKECLRQRLEAITVASWVMRDPAPSGLPWGKVSG